MNTGKKKWDYKLNREKFVGKAHYTIHVIPDDWSKTIPVSSEVIITYLEDSTRGGVNLLDPKMGKHGTAAKDFTGRNDVDFVVPCFYVGTPWQRISQMSCILKPQSPILPMRFSGARKTGAAGSFSRTAFVRCIIRRRWRRTIAMCFPHRIQPPFSFT